MRLIVVANALEISKLAAKSSISKYFFMRKRNKSYVSDIDQRFKQFDASQPLSASQLAEIKKHQRISHLRDTAETADDSCEIWQGF